MNLTDSYCSMLTPVSLVHFYSLNMSFITPHTGYLPLTMKKPVFSTALCIQLLLFVAVGSLLTACDGNTELMKHTLDGDPSAVQTDLANGAPVDARNNFGWTALMHAARQDQTATMAVLIDAGADINAQDDDGWTPLMRATTKGNVAAVQLLLQRKADTELADKNNWTPLLWASNRGYGDILELLIANGANVNAKGKNGRTALYLARNEKHNHILDVLQKAGAK
ncbi:ankyrin repeat protein, putative [hydrothermal vent metagenome]|uniref:Ankyrin repeat protein, putative n=1 Tax=hydrothermal vent metagenome TaxID=652676 RepID=A0A3B1A3N3_9ZZZZ